MATTDFIRARVGTGSDAIEKPTASDASDLSVIAQHMFLLMMRNIASDGFVIDDPVSGQPSKPGCVIAAPSFPRHTPGVDQDYVFNWVRDAAITALELAAAELPAPSVGGGQSLVDYVTFARLCRDNLAAAIRATPDTSLTLGHACFTVDGQPRPWSEQSDGPALQTIAVLQAYGRLDDATRQVARDLVGVNLDYLLSVYRQPTTNLWEEFRGFSFFARSVQLRCFEAVAGNTLGLPVPSGLADAAAWLRQELDRHWNGTHYVSILDPQPPLPENPGYDPNIDIVSACLYGAVPPTDTRLLATAEALRRQWSDPGSPSFYPVNGADRDRGLGPMLGRYPGDHYDGDTAHPVLGGHPWALCTCNLAELYYRLAAGLDAGGPVPLYDLSRGFFDGIGVGAATPAAQAAEALRAAGDRMLRAVVFHADHLELSEQFDGASGYEKSVTNLTWSYAAFLSAVRARTGRAVAG